MSRPAFSAAGFRLSSAPDHDVQIGGAGSCGWQGRDDVDRFSTPILAFDPAGPAGDLGGLGCVWEQDAGVDGDDCGGAGPGASKATVPLLASDRHVFPRQRLEP